MLSEIIHFTIETNFHANGMKKKNIGNLYLTLVSGGKAGSYLKMFVPFSNIY